EGPADRGQRGQDLVVRSQALEGVAGHDGEVKLAVPGDVGGLALVPRAGVTPAYDRQHRRIGIESHESAGVPLGAGTLQDRARPAPDIEHRPGIHDVPEVERIASTPGIQYVVEA